VIGMVEEYASPLRSAGLLHIKGEQPFFTPSTFSKLRQSFRRTITFTTALDD